MLILLDYLQKSLLKHFEKDSINILTKYYIYKMIRLKTQELETGNIILTFNCLVDPGGLYF